MNGQHRSPESLYLTLATVAFSKPKILVFILLQLRVGQVSGFAHIHILTCSNFSFPNNVHCEVCKKPFVTIHQIGFVHLIIKAEVQFKLFIMR